MTERTLWTIKTDGHDYWETKLNTMSIEEGFQKAMNAWNHLTALEKEKQNIRLVIGEEEEEEIFNYSDYDVLWDSSLQYVWNGYGYKTLEEAVKDAEHYAAYTQEDIIIYTPDSRYIRSWWGCLSGIELAEDPIRFGNFGFYGDWEEKPYMEATDYLEEEKRAIDRA